MRKKYLLIMPRVVKEHGEGYVFPLGISYISSNMKRAGFEIYNLNLNHTYKNWEMELINSIRKNNIDVVAIGGQSFQFNNIKEVLNIVKRENPEILIIVGGGIITADPETAMEALEFVDYGIVGEGEVTINELCNAIESDFNNIEKKNIDGIVYRENNSYFITNSRKEIENLSEIAWPDYEGFGYKYYVENIVPTMIASNKKHSLFMLTSRSCPYNCTFCFHTVGKKYRKRSLDDIFNELDYMINLYKIDFIYFVDELFGYDIKRLEEFCKRIKKYNIEWWSQFRVNDISVEKINILKNANCSIMTFGLESADNRILNSMRKGVTVDQIEQTLELVYRAGIAIDGCFIFGDTEETLETSMNTLKWWDKHYEYNIGLGFITVYPGTVLYRKAIEKGIIKDKVDFLRSGCPQINVSKMNSKEFSAIMDEITIRNMKSKKIPKRLIINKTDYKMGEISLSGKCTSCGYENNWDNVIVFRHTPLICWECGQRYDVPLMIEMIEIAEKNIKNLINKYNKIAIWGINDKVIELILSSKFLKETNNVVLIDISKIKQNRIIYNKNIYPPTILNYENIECIVIGVPFLFSNISLEIKRDYAKIKNVIDICSIFSFDLEG